MIQTIIDAAAYSLQKQSQRQKLLNFELSSLSLSTSKSATAEKDDLDIPEGEVKKRLEGMGFRIGWGLAERCVAQ